MSEKSYTEFCVRDVEYETNRKEEFKSKTFPKKFIFIETDKLSETSDAARPGHNLDLTKIQDRESESEFTETSVRVIQEHESSHSNLQLENKP